MPLLNYIGHRVHKNILIFYNLFLLLIFRLLCILCILQALLFVKIINGISVTYHSTSTLSSENAFILLYLSQIRFNLRKQIPA